MSTLDIQIHGPVARVYLNRPEVRNAFNDGVIAELTAAFARLGQDPGLRAIVLGGHGKAFCAGADLNWMRAMAGYTWEQNRADAQALADMLWTLYRCPLPIVGRVHGDCYAGGMGYMRGMAIERLWRDARILAIGGGATEVMLDEAAKRY